MSYNISISKFDQNKIYSILIIRKIILLMKTIILLYKCLYLKYSFIRILMVKVEQI